MGNSFIKREKFLCILMMLIIAAIVAVMGFALTSNVPSAYAAEGEEDAQPLSTAEAPILVKAYQTKDNSGYYTSNGKRIFDSTHPLGKNLINLSVYTQADYTQAGIDTGDVEGYHGYGITGSYAAIQLSYNFSDVSDMFVGDKHYAISSDTYQSVGTFQNIGVIGTGAMLFQKKTNANDKWIWQDKDGLSHSQLHTFNFTDLVNPSDFGPSGEKYTLYTPSGEDLSRGVYIKITFAYELTYTVTAPERNFWGIWKDVTTTHYTNIIEEVEFYLVQNSGQVLFHNVSNFGQVGGDEESGAFSTNKFETILSGDVTLNGFRIDTLGVAAYSLTYTKNGISMGSAFDGQFFLDSGRYDFTISRKIGAAIPYTIFVDRREPNDAVIGYFGQGFFTADSQRVYTTGQYPAYLAGANSWNINATDGSVAPIAGILYKIEGDGAEAYEVEVQEIKQTFGANYTTSLLRGTINEVGIYKAEFWGNPKYIVDGETVSGDVYHFIFRFEIVSEDTPTEPSINYAYLNGLIGFSDLQSKYYAVAQQTAGTGKAIFAFADYSGAYDFAYNIERAKVAQSDGKYVYKGTQYATQTAVLTAVDTAVQAMISVSYFDATNPQSYQTADVADDAVLELNFNQDIIVFLNDDEQEYMKAGLPSLNGRKYRYVSPDTGEIEEGILYFAFIKVANFESKTVTLTLKDTMTTYNILYGVSVEYQLGLVNAPSGVYVVREENGFGDFTEYEAVYLKLGDITGSLAVSIFRNGGFDEITFGKSHTTTENANGFILRSATNELDPYSIVKVVKDGQTQIYSFDEVADIWFSEAGTYNFTLVDRLGSTVSFTIRITVAVGYADIYLELDLPDDSIPTYFRAFVGQEIDLPTPTLPNDLFIFDGWLYNDNLIVDGKFTPQTVGNIVIWEQITQKYTYLNFDSNGGEAVTRIKAEVGVPLTLPETTKDGWAFGGWEYGGVVYSGTFTPTTANPTFYAVWNYSSTTISLYDGNLYQMITAHAGDKVILPFPERTGYTFFGWYLEESTGIGKAYYGQITKLDNIISMRLDALWIRNSDVELADLANGTGGRTRVHFVNEALDETVMQGNAGAVLSTPNPTRAGFVLVGWVWRTTAIAGKIYTGGTMTVPDDAGGKIMLEALWIARSTGGSQGQAAGGTVLPGDDGAEAGLLQGGLNLSDGLQTALLSGLFVAVAACGAVILLGRRRRGVLAPVALSAKAVKSAPVGAQGKVTAAAATTLEPVCTTSYGSKVKSAKKLSYLKLGLLSTAITIVLAGVLFTFSAFGDYGNFGVMEQVRENITQQVA
ncbi:MAG: InlB B-repeat-containing protein, partial [Clostridiaceae bacterium]|nr:InlB B-repeat-containing protein [Clostridiaceae bacterium]